MRSAQIGSRTGQSIEHLQGGLSESTRETCSRQTQ
jgi:hypothetical protein